MKRLNVGPDTNYLIIPINADSHWTAAVIANINGALLSDPYVSLSLRDRQGDS